MATVTHGALSSNNLVNGVLWDGWKWQDGGTPLSLTYFFAEDGGVSWTQSAKTALTTAFGTYAQVANITFSETAVRADANFVENLLTHAQQLGAVGSHDTPQGAASANTHIIDGTHSSSLAINQAGGYYTIDYSSWGGPSDWTADLVPSGGYVADIMIHELGHALGLKHPHDIIGSAPTFPGVTDGDSLLILDRTILITCSFRPCLTSNPTILMSMDAWSSIRHASQLTANWTMAMLLRPWRSISLPSSTSTA